MAKKHLHYITYRYRDDDLDSDNIQVKIDGIECRVFDMLSLEVYNRILDWFAGRVGELPFKLSLCVPAVGRDLRLSAYNCNGVLIGYYSLFRVLSSVFSRINQEFDDFNDIDKMPAFLALVLPLCNRRQYNELFGLLEKISILPL